ncbi:uncharacterized protein [Amphiura filiformis]|uniref:uncharacterized protein n=1 Tax=Amphiura filiformis TaxID=82378 RepID=UPI003B2212C0
MAATAGKDGSTVKAAPSAFQEGDLNVENIPILTTETHLYIKRATVLDIIRKTIDSTPDKKKSAQLLFEAICQEKSVDLIFTERLRSQMHSYSSLIRSKFKLNKVVDWSCRVVASEFIKQEGFESMCRENGQGLQGGDLATDVKEKGSADELAGSLPKADINGNHAENLESTSTSKQLHTHLHIGYFIVLDIVRQNLQLSAQDVAKLVFDKLCEEKSVSLTYTARLEDQIVTYISALRKELINEDDSSIEWPCKVRVSEFVNPEQFQQICRKDMYRKPQKTILNDLTKLLNLPERRILRQRKDTNLVHSKSSSKDSDSKQKTKLESWPSQASCYLKITQSTVLDMIKTNIDFLPSQLELLVFKTICQELSVTLSHTPRLQGVIQKFTSTLGSKIKEAAEDDDSMVNLMKEIEESPPWMIRVLASEFVHQEQFQQAACKEKKQCKPQAQGSINATSQDPSMPSCQRAGSSCHTSMQSGATSQLCDYFGVTTSSNIPSQTGKPTKNCGMKQRRKIKGIQNKKKPYPCKPLKNNSNEDSKEKKKKEVRQYPYSDYKGKFKSRAEVVLHSYWNKHVCCSCGLPFKTLLDMQVHNFNERHSVNRCMCSFSDEKTRKQNKRICSVCGKSYSTIDKLKAHNKCVLSIVGGDANVSRYCCYCGKRFLLLDNLKRHKWISHENCISGCFQCKYCSMFFDDMPRFKRHLSRHEKKYKNFWISTRSRRENKMTNIQPNHSTTHFDIRQFTSYRIAPHGILPLPPQMHRCWYCPQIFEAQFQVDLHSMWHVNYACCVCGAAFTHKGVLIQHATTHPVSWLNACKCHIMWSNSHHVQIVGLFHAHGMVNNICRSCGHQFGHVMDKERHQVCLETMRYLYLCCFCHILVGGPVSLGEHKKKCHSNIFMHSLPMHSSRTGMSPDVPSDSHFINDHSDSKITSEDIKVVESVAEVTHPELDILSTGSKLMHQNSPSSTTFNTPTGKVMKNEHLIE